MEKTVRIVNQSQLTSRQYMDRKTGEQKVINSISRELPPVRPDAPLQGAVLDGGQGVEFPADW